MVEPVAGSGVTSVGIVVSFGTALDTVVQSFGLEDVRSGGVTMATSVGSAAAQIVYAGGLASSSIIESGGQGYVLSGGRSQDTEISAGGYLAISAGGVADTAGILSGGIVTIQSGSLASGSILSGGDDTIFAEGVTSAFDIESGGHETVLSGGVSDDAVADSGGHVIVSAGGDSVGATAHAGGFETVSAGGTVIDTTIDAFGLANLLSGGLSVGAFVASAGAQFVYGEGAASATTIGFGGQAYVASNELAVSDIVQAGASLVISSGGLAVSTTLQSGGSVDLDPFGHVAGGTTTLDGGSDILSIVEGAAIATLQLAGSDADLYFQLSEDGDGSTIITAMGTPCYCRGTLILTDRGEVAVEMLRIGDPLVTASGAVRPLRWIGRRSYDGRFAIGNADILPVMIRAGALADGVPRRDLFVSPLHALHLDGVLVPAAALVNGASIVQAAAIDMVDYFHLELETHDILLAEGAPAESFVDDDSRGMFHNAAEFECLYPDFAAAPARYCAPRLESGEQLDALRAQIRDRAAPIAVSVPGPGGSGFEGHLDAVDHDRIRGWAVTLGADGPVRVRILDNGRTIAVVEAGLHRPDLAAVGKGDGCHGFDVMVPGGLDPSRRHIIQVQRVLDQAELQGSPVFLDMAAQPNPQPHVPLVPAAMPDDGSGCHGHVDLVRRGLIRGWAWDSQNPDRAVAVQIFSNGRVLARVVANAYRADLAAGGIGAGRHGFEIDLPGELSPLSRHVVHACIESTGRPLAGSPQVIEAADSFSAALEQTVAQAIDALATRDDQGRVLSFMLGQADRLRQQIADLDGERQLRERGRRLRRTLGPAAPATALAMPRALVIDERVPLPSRDAGSQAALSHMRALHQLGYRVSFVSTEEFDATGAPLAALEAMDVTVCGSPVYAGVEDVLRRQAGCFDVVYMHRVSTASAYMALARRHMPQARLLYSVADLHHLRLSRQAEVEQRPELFGLSHRVRLQEFTAAWQADAVLTHSTAEADLLRRAVPAACVREVPWACAARHDDDTGPAFEARAGVALVGNYGHQPNEDAACWLVETVMPLVWRQDPAIPCLVAGSDLGPRVRRLARPGVELLGHVPDLATLWDRVRLSVAPLRYGAGVKGKVLDSLAAGVPCVMSPVGAEGLSLPAALAGLVGQDAAALATLICRLHGDMAVHAAARATGLAFVRARNGEDVVADALKAAIEGRRPAFAAAG